MRKAPLNLYPAKHYLDYLDELQKLISTRPVTNLKPNHKISSSFLGLPQLLSTFDAISPASWDPKSSKYIEWNPFSQKLFFRLGQRSNLKDLFSDLDESIIAVDRFIEISHEAAHVLLWEPFFVGKMGKMSPGKFLDLTLYFEAFCFWYADMIVTRKLRIKLPHGELAKSRNAVSQSSFHPHQAFKAMKMNDELEILDQYLESFQGIKTRLYRKNRNIFIRELVVRFGVFYYDTLKPARFLYKQLKSTGTFNSFHERFCDIAGLPTVFPEKILSIDCTKNTSKYCHSVFKYGFKHMQSMKSQELDRVKLRRSIQTRAYSAFSLLTVLKTGNHFAIDGKSFRKDLVEIALKKYIDTLEQAIRLLANKAPLSQIKRLCDQNDRMYTKKIQHPMKNADLWVSNRQRLFPLLEANGANFGLIDYTATRSKKEAKIINEVATKIAIQEVLDPSRKPARSSKSFADFLNIISEPDFFDNPKKKKKWSQSLLRFLKEQDVVDGWSAPLNCNDPENNLFRELLFSYL